MWQQDIKGSDYLKSLIVSSIVLYIITFLFFNSIWAYLFSLPLLLIYIKSWEQQQEIQLKQQFILQFREYLLALATAMGAGYAVENAMVEARKDIARQYDEGTKIMRDLYQMERLLGMNISTETIWIQWSNIIQIKELDQFVTVFTIAKRAGGDSVRIISKAIQNISDRIEVEQEIYVSLTSKRLEFQVMSVIPIGIILYMRLSFPDFMEVLYGNMIGILIMTICLVVYILAYLWGRKIVEIEV